MPVVALTASSHRAGVPGRSCSRAVWMLLPAALLLGGDPAMAAPSAVDGAQLAVDQGCMNCHSNQSKTAPPLNRLAEKMARKGDQPDALQPVLRELRGQTAIRGHQAVSDASLLAILQWLAQGAK